MDSKTTAKAELVGLKVMKASEMIQDSANALFKLHGLSSPQYNVLRILRGAGGPGLNCQEISARMLKRVPDITRLLDRLVKKGLVDRTRSDEDRRVVVSGITRQGLKLLKTLDNPLEKQVAGNFDHLDNNEMNRLDKLLDRLLAGLGT